MRIAIDKSLLQRANIKLILGCEPEGVFRIPEHEEEIDVLIKSLSETAQGKPIVIGLHLSIKREIIGRLTELAGLSEAKGTLKWCIAKMRKHKLGLGQCVAVLPDAESPRFCFDYSDYGTHRFLVNEIFFPRRYSLALLPRLFLHIYRLYVKLFTVTNILYRGVYLRVEVL